MFMLMGKRGMSARMRVRAKCKFRTGEQSKMLLPSLFSNKLKKNQMKKINLILGTTFMIFTQISFSQVAKKILVEHFTNTNCSVCASRNPGFYTNLFGQTNVLHLAIHPSSPYASCLLYQQNATANDARTNYYSVYGGTPRLVINGVVISNSTNYSNSSIFSPYQSLTTSASIRVVQQKFGMDSIRSTIIIKTEATNTLGILSLFVALAEDTVFYTGGNGETKHFDVFRKSLTSTTGNSVSLATNVGDSVVFTFSSPSNSIWNFSRIYTIAVLQETSTKFLVQAEAVSASANVLTKTTERVKSINASVFPNPTDKFISIQLPESMTAKVSLIDIEGKVVLKHGFSQANFQFDISSLPKGTYLLKIKTDNGEYNQKIIKQ